MPNQSPEPTRRRAAHFYVRRERRALVTIGITGGSTLFELGSRDDVLRFFHRVRESGVGLDGDVSLISDRLYRRYLRPTELAPAALVLAEVIRRMESVLNPRDREFDRKMLRGFRQCAESAGVNYEAFRDSDGYAYEPVRIVIADRPQFVVEKRRNLADYEALADEPFWAHPAASGTNAKVSPNHSPEPTPGAAH